MNSINDRLNALASFDRDRGTTLKAYQKPLVGKESELSLSEAAQRLTDGHKVTLEESHSSSFPVTYTRRSFWKGEVLEQSQRTATLTQKVRTGLTSGDDLDSFIRVQQGEKAANPTEELAAKLKPLESHVEGNQLESFNLVHQGLFGGRQLKDNPASPSAFEAARMLEHGKPVAVVQSNLDDVLNSYDFQSATEHSQVTYLASASDLQGFLAR